MRTDVSHSGRPRGRVSKNERTPQCLACSISATSSISAAATADTAEATADTAAAGTAATATRGPAGVTTTTTTAAAPSATAVAAAATATSRNEHRWGCWRPPVAPTSPAGPAPHDRAGPAARPRAGYGVTSKAEGQVSGERVRRAAGDRLPHHAAPRCHGRRVGRHSTLGPAAHDLPALLAGHPWLPGADGVRLRADRHSTAARRRWDLAVQGPDRRRADDSRRGALPTGRGGLRGGHAARGRRRLRRRVSD